MKIDNENIEAGIVKIIDNIHIGMNIDNALIKFMKSEYPCVFNKTNNNFISLINIQETNNNINNVSIINNVITMILILSIV